MSEHEFDFVVVGSGTGMLAALAAQDSGDLGTCGGIRADGFARALRPDGSVIAGLYASGNSAGNAFGRVYPGPGATIGQGLACGYIAARHAAGKL